MSHIVMMYDEDEMEPETTNSPQHKTHEKKKINSSLIMSKDSIEWDVSSQGLRQSNETFFNLKHATVNLDKSIKGGFTPKSNFNMPNIPTSTSGLSKPLLPK